MSYSYFVIPHQSLPSQSFSGPVRTTEAIFVVCIRRLGCIKGCHSDCCRREEERGEETKRGKKRKKKEGGSERRGGAVSTGEISSEHSSAEKTRAELEMSEEERWAGQSQTVPTWSLLQWLFDPQLVWTLTVQLLGINYYYNNSWADISI